MIKFQKVWNFKGALEQFGGTGGFQFPSADELIFSQVQCYQVKLEKTDVCGLFPFTVRSSRAMATALSPGHSSLFFSHDRFVQR